MSLPWPDAVHTRFDAEIRTAAAEAGLPDWLLLKALVAQESSFNPRAFRPESGARKGSYGLTQVLWSTARHDLGYEGAPDGLFEPATNLRFGAAYLVRMLRMFGGDVRLALAAYNAGPGRVSILRRRHGPRYEGVEPHLPKITRLYVANILRYREAFAQFQG